MICHTLYHGKKAWPHPTHFGALFREYEDSPGIKKYLPCHDYVLYDLSDKDIISLEISLTLKACLYTLKHIRHDDFRARLPGLFDMIKDIPLNEGNKKVLKRLTVYIYQGSDINISEYKEYIHAIDRTEVEKIMITTYEQILQEGRQEGKIRSAERMIERGYPIQDVLEINELELEDLKQAGLVDQEI